MHDVFFGRQPIYNQGLEIVGYELLFHSGETHLADFQDSSQATSQVILNTVVEMGLERVVGSQHAFINVTRDFIENDLIASLDKDKVVLELVDLVATDVLLLSKLRAIRSQGYTIALDNGMPADAYPALVNVVDMVKLDVGRLNVEELRIHVEMLRKHGFKIVAKRVQTQEEFKVCEELGFDYFQGYFLTEPNIVKGKRLPANRIAVLNLLGKLQHPSTTSEDIEELVSRDVFLTYRLLRFINAAQFALSKKVESIKRAILLVGLARIKNWVSLIALSKIDDKPHDLIVTALARGKMCELLATAAERENADSYFIAGLFSVLDAIMDRPMDELLKAASLNEEICAALMKREGDMGQLLRCVVGYERGNWNQVIYAQLDDRRIIQSYLEAIDWANNLCTDLLAA